MKNVLSVLTVCLLLWIGCGGDSEAPVVEITHPTDGSMVSGTVSITADASDDNEVDSVQFYIDDTLRSTSTAEPYGYSWVTTGLQNQSSHTIYAIAYDAAENESVSDTISVIVVIEGILKWRFATGDEVHSSPAIGADGTVYVGSYDHYLYAMNPDGTFKWSYQTGGTVYSSPAIGTDGTVYVGSSDNRLYAINPNGTLQWSYQTGGAVSSSPAIGADGTIYVGSSNYPFTSYLYAINPDGTLKWSCPAGMSMLSSPAIGTDGTIYIGSDGGLGDGYLYAINPGGVVIWSYPMGFGFVASSPAIGADGTIYVGSNGNYLYAMHPAMVIPNRRRCVFFAGDRY
jgi:outer membrane protein assembly factor BamB